MKLQKMVLIHDGVILSNDYPMSLSDNLSETYNEALLNKKRHTMKEKSSKIEKIAQKLIRNASAHHRLYLLIFLLNLKHNQMSKQKHLQKV